MKKLSFFDRLRKEKKMELVDKSIEISNSYILKSDNVYFQQRFYSRKNFMKTQFQKLIMQCTTRLFHYFSNAALNAKIILHP